MDLSEIRSRLKRYIHQQNARDLFRSDGMPSVTEGTSSSGQNADTEATKSSGAAADETTHSIATGQSAEHRQKIPRFYYRLPNDDDVIQLKLREEARATFLQKRSKVLMDNEELKELWVLLEKTAPAALENEEQMMDYGDFKRISQLVGAKARPYFTVEVFAKLLQGDARGRISVLTFFNYVMRRVWLNQTRIALSLYDVSGQGYLRECDLENYILELIPTLPQLKDLEASFYPFYVCTVVRRFFFFLDPFRHGRVKILDILCSGFLDDLLELRNEEKPRPGNWFSASNAIDLYSQYLDLDKDHNGMLNKEELASFRFASLTEVFIERVFEECITYDGEIDFKTYIDFVLAFGNMKEPQALHYFFRLLDIDGKGHLDVFTIYYFFKAIQDASKRHGIEPISFDDVQHEIFDMIRPAKPQQITLRDLIKSDQGPTVVSILIDFHGFLTYENRERIKENVNEEAEV